MTYAASTVDEAPLADEAVTRLIELNVTSAQIVKIPALGL
jgi:hypothetical protein